MLTRQTHLSHLENYLNEVDTEVTMILQSLQWDRKHLLEQMTMVPCTYNANHRVPPDKIMEHENVCLLKSQGYTLDDRLLPSPVDTSAMILVKLDATNIAEIIHNASRNQPLFKTGPGCSGIQPLTLERLQATYTADERRAIHDAVVKEVPSCHDLADLALLSSNEEENKDVKRKSKLEILAELRDMKRRRTKYRVAAKSRNYSDVLRDVISTQMDLYTQAQDNLIGQIKKEKNDVDAHIGCKDDIIPNQNLKAIDDTHKASQRYESRKRRHYDSDDAYKSKYSKIDVRDRATSSKTYEQKGDMYCASKINDYGKTDKREKRYTNSLRDNKDKHKRNDDYGREKRHNEKNRNDSTDEHYDYKEPQSGRRSSKGNSSDIQKERQIHDYYDNGKLKYENNERDINKIYVDKHKQNKTGNREKHSYDDDSSSNEYNDTEKSKIYNKSDSTSYHKHKSNHPKTDNVIQKRYGNFSRRSIHDDCKQGSGDQEDGKVVVKKERNINEEKDTMSNHSKDYESKSTRSYEEYQKSTKKNYSHDKRYSENYKLEKKDAHRKVERTEALNHKVKSKKHIKEEPDSSLDTYGKHVSNSSHHNRSSSHSYNSYDKRYSKSYKERHKEYSERDAKRRRYDDCDER